MRKVSIKDLKASLSTTVAAAEAGDTVIVTRHNTPVAQLGPIQTLGVHPGAEVGRGLRPLLKRGTKGRYLEVLLEDRGDR